MVRKYLWSKYTGYMMNLKSTRTEARLYNTQLKYTSNIYKVLTNSIIFKGHFARFWLFLSLMSDVQTQVKSWKNYSYIGIFLNIRFPSLLSDPLKNLLDLEKVFLQVKRVIKDLSHETEITEPGLNQEILDVSPALHQPY